MCAREEELEETETVSRKIGRRSWEGGMNSGRQAERPGGQGLQAGYWIGDEETAQSAQQRQREGETMARV